MVRAEDDSREAKKTREKETWKDAGTGIKGMRVYKDTKEHNTSWEQSPVRGHPSTPIDRNAARRAQGQVSQTRRAYKKKG